MNDDANKIKYLDANISKIAKSTKASFGIAVPLHDIIRHKYSWYYNWHLNSYSSGIHILIFAVYLIGIGILSYAVFSDPVSSTYASGVYSDYR